MPAAGDPTADLKAALQVLVKADDGNTPLDNEKLAKALKWDLDRTALCLQSAKDQSLIWGHREGRKPSPWFSSLEVTVQGRRFLRGAS
ncbi:MAG: hypothetical protein WCI22_00255 [Actinomycetota bacterium]